MAGFLSPGLLHGHTEIMKTIIRNILLTVSILGLM